MRIADFAATSANGSDCYARRLRHDRQVRSLPSPPTQAGLEITSIHGEDLALRQVVKSAGVAIDGSDEAEDDQGFGFRELVCWVEVGLRDYRQRKIIPIATCVASLEVVAVDGHNLTIG